jgi:hypothetical protein
LKAFSIGAEWVITTSFGSYPTRIPLDILDIAN